jgi:hypothetical protein
VQVQVQLAGFGWVMVAGDFCRMGNGGNGHSSNKKRSVFKMIYIYNYKAHETNMGHICNYKIK